MHLTFQNLMIAFVLMLTITGCNKHKETQEYKPNLADKVTSTATTDQWIGTWQGPEGTFLQIAGKNGQYDIVIQNLDGPCSFQGTTINNEIAFERDGIRERIHATSGKDTGMKWLTDKSNCLTVKDGEGYCRD
jgi:hypothetical protein